LAELDRLTTELRSARETDRTKVRWLDPELLNGEATPPEPTPGGIPALYLEERIDTATRLALQLGGQLDRDGARTGVVDRRLEEIHEELGQAARELQFLVAESGGGFEQAGATRSDRPEWDESEDIDSSGSLGGSTMVLAPEGSKEFPAASFEEFTADRYDRTIRQLKSRRRRLFGWTIGLAVGISASLEALNLLAREPTPPIWLAILPVVWLIPVPFFILSFRGTQRILTRNHLETGVEG
jgi:hypothetical protein